MSYEARVFNVMVASPSDVAKERKIIQDLLYLWNAIHSEREGMVLLPLGWDTHSSPEMGKPPQDIINKQVAEKCDLLVGVFWTRLGTPTGKYSSGTVEEIEKHINADKPVMLYFSNEPVALAGVDQEQYQQLINFKEDCKNRGLYEEYGSLSEFKDLFNRQLQIKVNENPMFYRQRTDRHTKVVSTSLQLPAMTYEAKVLLKEASQGEDGTITHLRTMDGTDIQTNNKNIVSSNERREVAPWESAIEELLKNKLLIERGNKGEIYEVTNHGYKIADIIEL